ncbi:MAG: hypothetical protein IJ057_03590 [Bacteroidales bacterium]|nr:hypothetical protein [Bacteroidales bacterium]
MAVSLIAHAGGGWDGFPERVSDTRIDHFMGALGADAKFGFNDNWSLLVGLDYQFRFINSGYTTYSGGIEHHSKFLQGHYLRLPVRVEYDYNRFYVAAGPYLEKGFGNMPEKYELGLVGVNLELGGRFELNRYDHLRVSLLTSFGVSFDNKPIVDYDQNGHEIETGKHFGMGYTELNFLLRVGYEHQF